MLFVKYEDGSPKISKLHRKHSAYIENRSLYQECDNLNLHSDHGKTHHDDLGTASDMMYYIVLQMNR